MTPIPTPTPSVLHDLPLFPLGTVLFPDGLLPLQIFEVRYLDMIGRCRRQVESADGAGRPVAPDRRSLTGQEWQDRQAV